MIFWAVPKGHMPWRAVWPGAVFVTVVLGIANWAFPFYLANVSSLSRFGSTLGFVLIALVWFYALSLALLAGAVINSLRHELHETGEMPYANKACRRRKSPAAAKRPEAEPQPYLSPMIARSLERSWRAWTRRTVPERERMTSDSVVAPGPR